MASDEASVELKEEEEEEEQGGVNLVMTTWRHQQVWVRASLPSTACVSASRTQFHHYLNLSGVWVRQVTAWWHGGGVWRVQQLSGWRGGAFEVICVSRGCPWRRGDNVCVVEEPWG